MKPEMPQTGQGGLEPNAS